MFKNGCDYDVRCMNSALDSAGCGIPFHGPWRFALLWCMLHLDRAATFALFFCELFDGNFPCNR